MPVLSDPHVSGRDFDAAIRRPGRHSAGEWASELAGQVKDVRACPIGT